MEGKNDELARRVSREGDPSRAGRHADDKRHSGQDPAKPALQRHHAHPGGIIFPEKHMMFKEYRIVRAEIYLRNGHDLTFDLAGASAEADLSHVLDPGSFSPTRLANQVFDVERSTARTA